MTYYASEKTYNVAIVGATGNTGAATIEILEDRKFPTANLIPIASKRLSGRKISFRKKTIKVCALEDIDFSEVDLTFFCAGNAVSCKYANQVASSGSVVIDKSSYFRLNPKVPLVIPEVNTVSLMRGILLGIISTPNCIVVPLALTLKALSEVSPIKRVVVSTYQSVSGAGRRAIDELYSQTKAVIAAARPVVEVFPKQIAYNVIPTIGNINEFGYCEEEEKISAEICKILKADIKVAITCVRVPTFIGHCLSLACEFTKPITEEDVFEVFNNANGIVTLDRRKEGIYATPVDVQGEDAVYVSRIRKDPTVKHGVILWVACDNLRKGAALNSVQIAETLVKDDPSLVKFKKHKEK